MKNAYILLLLVACGSDVRPEAPDAPVAIGPDYPPQEPVIGMDAGIVPADAPVDAPADAKHGNNGHNQNPGYEYDAGCPVLPGCAFLGCDGSQKVPLWCPPWDNSSACFCVSPSGPDGWCFDYSNDKP